MIALWPNGLWSSGKIWPFCQTLEVKVKTVSESFFEMFEAFCKFGILTAFIKSTNCSGRTKAHGIEPPNAQVRGEKG